MTHKKWITWLFQHSKTSDGTRIRKDSPSLNMFWDLYKLFQPNFQGIQERLISSLIYSVGDSSPAPLSVDAMMVLTCCWLVRCDVLHDRNLYSRLPANIAFFLPYACTVLHPQYFSIDQLGHYIGRTRNNGKSNRDGSFPNEPDSIHISLDENQNTNLLHMDDDEEDDLDTVDPIERAEILRKFEPFILLSMRAEKGKKLREKNVRLFTLLALYMQQNILEDKNGENVSLRDIDFDNQDQLMNCVFFCCCLKWYTIDTTYNNDNNNNNNNNNKQKIFDVMTHIATTLKACLTSEEPSIHHALGDFCQALIDLFIPTQAATLARVFSVCLDVGDDLQKLGCIQALGLFVPRLLKQCKQLNIFQEVISVTEKHTQQWQ
ncbi:hypothetical protein RFI_20282 [Reticulomyxa filosa]|uniref:Uncharacterized protein n=1 Tax=Reticulomyxa filosa TaxID=46433 RepID=X6MSU2_RETFI|nr:hypothetical protein RFI_20282 [Reticulomyxa filosa]|eukprot:ETO17048.1 hypothetical protein RFI_20282 [Reticulomyxa filosa]